MPSAALKTEVTIEASAERVWNVLTTFVDLPTWNTFLTITSSAPVVKEGDRLNVVITPSTGEKNTFNTLVLKWVPGQEFRWVGKLWGLGFMFKGEHYFQITQQPDGKVLFTHGELFSGILVPMLGGLLTKTENEFHKFNKDLKTKAES